MIGFCTKYRKHDATIATTTLLRHLDKTGQPIHPFTTEWKTPKIDPAFDNRVLSGDFNKLTKRLRQLCWTMPASMYQLRVTAECAIKNIIYIGWDQADRTIESAKSYYRYVLVPTQRQGERLKERLKVDNIAILTYSPPLPITKKTRNAEYDKTKLFMSLYGSQLRRCDMAAVVILGNVVRDNPHVYVTVSASKGLARPVVLRLKELGESFGARWKVKLDEPWSAHVLEMGRSDLTVWPARWDGYGQIGLSSLHMGTPVVSWDAYPFKEHLSQGRNAILVSCDVETDWRGVDFVRPNYREFERILNWLVTDKEALTELRRHTHEKLEENKALFVAGMAKLFPLSDE